MLFLLRNIRRKLMQKNKFTTYLLYAIGEIVLVVIGILIAVSVNNWNARRNAETESNQLLQELILDLARDTTRFSSIVNEDALGFISAKKAIRNCSLAITLTYEDLTPQLADSLISIDISSGLSAINAETSTFDEIKSNGKLYNLTTDSLKRKIVDYYSLVQREESYNRTSRTLIDKIAFEDISAIWLLDTDRMYQEDFDLKNYAWLFDKNSREMKEYREFLIKSMSIEYNNMTKFEYLQSEASLLIEEIKTELDKQ